MLPVMLIGTFELENLTTGAKILSVAPADNNNITAGNSQNYYIDKFVY